jgi:FAD/FMN-containing dehydrogenase
MTEGSQIMTTEYRVGAQTPQLTDVEVQVFQTSLRGRLIRPADEGYDAARTVYNRMIDKRPALIAQCAGVSDVINAVNFARDHNLLVAVRGGGHSVAGYSVNDGGLVIDLSQMKGIWIDPSHQIARVEPGVTWGELNHDLQHFGLGATGGYISVTGVAGLTLGGGFGWLIRKHGLALDNLTSVDVVSADGQLHTASQTQNEDLFWGIRGGGGNFGVVTSFEMQIHPVGMVLGGLIVHPIAKAKDVLRFYWENLNSFPDELTSGVLMFHMPELPFLPPEMHGVPVVAIAPCYAGDLDQGEQVVGKLREFGPPLADMVQPMPYSAAQTMADVLWPPNLNYYWKSHFMSHLPDAAIDEVVGHFDRVPSKKTVVLLEQSTSSAMRRVAPDATAFPHRNWPMNLLISSGWESPADTEANIDWTRDFAAAMDPFTEQARYVNYNFITDEGANGIQGTYGANYERLKRLKTKYDPGNLFRLNPNIEPGG